MKRSYPSPVLGADKYQQSLFDTGVPNLLFPTAQTKAKAAATQLLNGLRGVSGIKRANNFRRVTDFFTRFESALGTFVQIKTQSAEALASKIDSVNGVVGILLCPTDNDADNDAGIDTNTGISGNPMHADFRAFIKPTARKRICQSIYIRPLVLDPTFAKSFLSKGSIFCHQRL